MTKAQFEKATSLDNAIRSIHNQRKNILEYYTAGPFRNHPGFVLYNIDEIVDNLLPKIQALVNTALDEEIVKLKNEFENL